MDNLLDQDFEFQKIILEHALEVFQGMEPKIDEDKKEHLDTLFSAINQNDSRINNLNGIEMLQHYVNKINSGNSLHK
jgi:hypothetical protein